MDTPVLEWPQNHAEPLRTTQNHLNIPQIHLEPLKPSRTTENHLEPRRIPQTPDNLEPPLDCLRQWVVNKKHKGQTTPTPVISSSLGGWCQVKVAEVSHLFLVFLLQVGGTIGGRSILLPAAARGGRSCVHLHEHGRGFGTAAQCSADRTCWLRLRDGGGSGGRPGWRRLPG